MAQNLRDWCSDTKKPSWIIQTHCWFQLGKRKRSKKLQFDTPDGTVLKCFTYLNPGGPRVAGGDRRPKTRAQLLILLIEDFPKIHQYWSSQKYIYPPGNSHKPNERKFGKSSTQICQTSGDMLTPWRVELSILFSKISFKLVFSCCEAQLFPWIFARKVVFIHGLEKNRLCTFWVR